jgi:hypothetical protein
MAHAQCPKDRDDVAKSPVSATVRCGESAGREAVRPDVGTPSLSNPSRFGIEGAIQSSFDPFSVLSPLYTFVGPSFDEEETESGACPYQWT